MRITLFVGTGMMTNKRTIGLTATGTLKRSDYGITAIPLTSDEVKIDIAAPFERAE